MIMNTRVLWVLMWKHALVRLRQPVLTTVDITTPVMYFVIIFVIHLIKEFGFRANQEDNMANTNINPIGDIKPRPYWLMYTPESKLTNSLMDDVGVKLKLKRLSSNSDFKEPGYFPLLNGSRLVDIAMKMNTTEALLLFDDMSGEKWPTRLKYTIRMKGTFETETSEESKSEPKPQKKFYFEYGTFMVIQWAVDTSYIKMLTGTDVPQNLSLQRFPNEADEDRSFAASTAQLLSVLCSLSLMMPFVFLMTRLMQERCSGNQELMKAVGVSQNAIWLSHFLNVLPIGVILAVVCTVACKVTAEPLLPQTNGFLIFLMMLLYFKSVIGWAFVFSYVSKSAHYALILSQVTYPVLWGIGAVLSGLNMSLKLRLLTGLWPQVPMNWFWMEVSTLELTGHGANFSNLTQIHTHKMVPPILVGFLFMLLQILICYVLTWYLSLVRPGQYGQALPWNFLCKPGYWSSSAVGPDVVEEDHTPLDNRYFEPGPPHTEAGIKVVNVSKVYPKHTALNKVSLEVYKGEITVLLGHNGAGKTTLMSIITGMTSATEGKVFVNGKDLVKQKNEVRKNIGLCTQSNMLFDEMTVREHIMFFIMLNRSSYSEASQSASQLAEQLGLSDKLKSMVSDLSGGMKRRVQLACALAGGADVLVLDEPTSGLDVETRRNMWDLLLSLRGERTVLLTTHFMEEADALGDRVAALSGGVLKCFATPMHLKKAVGTGYRLSLTTIDKPKEEAITKVVTSHVHDATLKERTNNSLSYNLPAAHSGQFSKLFSALEAMRSKLGIDSIGVGVSTLEEVFLKLCSDIDTSELYEEEAQFNDSGREPELPPDKLKGISLYVRQLYVLLKRQVKYEKHKGAESMFQLVVPIIIICFITDIANKDEKREPHALLLTLERFDPPNFVLYRLEGPHVTPVDIEKLQAMWHHKGTFLKTDDVSKTLLQMNETNSYKYLAGVEVGKNEFKVLSNTMRRHVAPVALNLLSNLLAVHNIPSSDGNSIITINDPIAREIIAASPKEPKTSLFVLMWGVGVISVILTLTYENMTLPYKDRMTGARHIHIMSGCPVELHWLATLISHMVIALGIIIGAVIAANFIDRENTFNQPDMLGTLTLILFLGCMAYFPIDYLVSFYFGETIGKLILFVFPLVFVVMTAPMKTLLEATGQDAKINFFKGFETYILIILSYVATPHVITETALRCLLVGRINAYCKLNKERCPALNIDDQAFDAKKCCAGEKPRCYFCIDKYSPLPGIFLLLVHFLVLMTLVCMTDRGIFKGLMDKVMNRRYDPTQPAEQDDMVRAEKAYVSRAITLPADKIPDAMLVDDLHKNYVKFCSKNVNAIKGVSFSVKKGECFGLLGVSGAGKSTCFKMMTTEECPTRGNIFGNGYFLRRGNTQYLQTLGYCPQSFGLDMFQTGEENLAMVLTLRGYDTRHVEELVQTWIKIVGLEKYATQLAEEYSGGCVRRLGTASALCGSAELSLLDEPTAGVDVVARRRVWIAVRKAVRSQRSVVITSHSIDEIEALCARIAILAGGRMRALGTAVALRAAHAQGHTVVFKVKYALPGDDVDGARRQLNELKSKVKEIFNCSLKDEHKTTLHYHINETMLYSKLFVELETLREGYPDLIEDYTVTETTLEEVFLSFAQEQRTDSRQAV